MTPLALLAVALAAPVPKELKALPPLFPTAIETVWEYVEEKTGKLDHTREVVAEDVNTDGSRTANIRWTSHGSSYGPRTDYRVDANTVSWVGTVDGRVPARPYLLFRRDAKPGEKWDIGIEAEVKGGEPRYTAVQEAAEDVTTPAGTFKAIRVRNTYGNHDCWFAPGIGMVKWNLGDRTVVLSKFTPGKGAKK